MQYRNPVGLGPSSKTCPRCASQRAHNDFCSYHTIASIFMFLDIFICYGLPEAWPSSSRVKLSIRIEQIRSTTNTFIYSIFMTVMVFAGKCKFCSLLSCNIVGFFAQYISSILHRSFLFSQPVLPYQFLQSRLVQVNLHFELVVMIIYMINQN